MSLDLVICPFLSLAFSSSLFASRPVERYGRPHPAWQGRGGHVRLPPTMTRIDPMPAARLHRDLSR